MARNLPPATNPLRKLFGAGGQQDFFQALADRLEQGVLLLSPDGNRIIACNHALPVLTGFTRGEIEGLRPADLLQGEPGARALSRILQTEPGQTQHATEVPLHTRAEKTALVDLEASRVGAEGTPLLVMVTATDARRRREQDAEGHQARLKGLVSIARSMLGSGVTELAAALEAGQAFLSAEALALYRVSPTKPNYIVDGPLPESFPKTLAAAEVKGLNRTERWQLGERPDHPLQKAARVAGLGALHTGLIGTKNAWVGLLVGGWRSPDTVPADVDDLLAILGSFCHAAIQVSVQQATSAQMGVQLKALQAEASGQLNAVNDALLALDTDLKIVRLNRSARAMLGYPDEDIEGLAVQDVLVGPEDITATLLDALGHERTAERSKVVLHHRDGTPFPVYLRAVPLSTEAPTRLLLVLSDQTERQAMQDQNELLAQRALLGEVSAIFAHEVRNPINNISTGIQLVASRLGEDHPLYDSLDRVKKECTRLDQLMSDVLFFTRRLELKMEVLDLGELLKRMLLRWKPRLERAGVRSHFTLAPQTPHVWADPRTLEQVFVNLITNALQAMEEGGTLSISLAPIETKNGRRVEVQVADTGPGISQEQIDRIFDPFFTTKKDGTGLGLAISRRIISAHKGSIQVEAFADAGTVFTLELPTAAQAVEEEAE